MGGALKGIGNVALSGFSGGLLGDNPISQALGLNGAQGDYYKPVASAQMDPRALNEAYARAGVGGDADASQKTAAYGQGDATLGDTLNYGNARYSGPQLEQFQQNLATNPLSGSKLATDQVQSNPILGQLFGKDGTLDRTNAEEQRLATQGFQLTPEDHEAYGQASGNIARMFGQSEQNAAQSLSDRGLSSAPSGAAGAMFSGLQGNKNEQLAQAQTQIANDRMQNTMQRLGQTRNFLSQLGQQGEGAINDQFGRNLAGVQNSQGQQNNLVNDSLNKYKADIVNANNQNEQQQDSVTSQKDNKGKTLFDAFGQGLFSGVSKLGSKAPDAVAGGGIG